MILANGHYVRLAANGKEALNISAIGHEAKFSSGSCVAERDRIMRSFLLIGVVEAVLTGLLLFLRQRIMRPGRTHKLYSLAYLITFDDSERNSNAAKEFPDQDQKSLIRIRLPRTIMTFRKHTSAAKTKGIFKLKKIGHLIALIAFALTITNGANAQATNPTEPTKPVMLSSSADIKTDDKDKDKKTDGKKSDDSELTPREKALLERIEKLEQRLAEVEARTGTKSATDAPTSNSTSTQTDGTTTSASNSTPAQGIKLDTSVNTQAQNQSPPATNKQPDPFAFADFTWLNGTARTKESPMDTKFFTPEIRFDVNYTDSLHHPVDHTIGGSSEVFRSGEAQLTQLGVGGDFHYDNVQGRVMTQFGMYSTTTPRNDASPTVGQWQLDNAYRYISEAYGGYHIDKLDGINIQAGIFMSYIGLFSYYQFDNWAYQPSYVSSNTPWFFNGVRVQIFANDKLKIEPWIINGWQSYGKFNHAPGVGGQILWRPTGNIQVTSNNYYGTDALGIPDRKRIHTDDSFEYKYYDQPERLISKAAFTLTGDIGCENGGGVTCTSRKMGTPAQYFIGGMVYHRVWFDKDRYAVTLGGGAINNPGRYLVLLPPINGATAASGTPYFTENPGDPFRAWDASVTFDYMPSQYITFRGEFNHRAANVPYFSGHGGITPPTGNVGPPGSFVPGFVPDLQKRENRFTLALLVKF